jgi:hypothetical protein
LPIKGSSIFLVTDVETDGPDPGTNSMLSFAAVARGPRGEDFGHFAINLEPLHDGVSDPDTMRWWETQPEAWSRATERPVAPALGISSYVRWIKSLPGTPIFAAHPLTFDGIWIDWYLQRFAGIRLFYRPRKEGLCFGSGVDIQSFAMGVLDRDYRDCSRPSYPPEWFESVPHNHCALDDAIGYANLLTTLLRLGRQGE